MEVRHLSRIYAFKLAIAQALAQPEGDAVRLSWGIWQKSLSLSNENSLSDSVTDERFESQSVQLVLTG